MNDKQVLVVARDQFALKRLSDEAMREILPAYTRAIQNIIDGLQSLPPEGSLQREFWLRSQLNTIEMQLKQVEMSVLEVLPRKEREAFEQGLQNAEQFLKADDVAPVLPQRELVGVASDTSPAFVGPGNAAGEFMRPSITQQQVLAAAQDRGFKEFLSGPTGANKKGYSLQELVSKNTQIAVSDVEGKLRAGFLLGQTNQEIARNIGDAFGGSKNKAIAMTDAVVRTSMAEASQAAHDMFYDANKDALPDVPGGYKFEWDATNDTRLCEECAPLDGLRFKDRADAPPWPAHWNCRCKILPITSTETQLRRDGDVPKGSFLERKEVTYTNGKRDPAPAGWRPVKEGGTAYSRPKKQDGKMYWVRRVDMDKGKNLAGDMLQKMTNRDSKHAILQTWENVNAFEKLTGKGGKYYDNPQDAVRLLLAGKVSPPKGAIAPLGTRRRRQGK